MDVRCDRCGTEYEFDDALLSERGTTVQCTECGFQFKVFPAHGAPAPERWVVRSGTGQGWENEYGSLRDLQGAILRGAVGPDDVLSRGLEAPRPLASIAELEPLFAERPPERFGRTLAGVAPQAGGVPPAVPVTGSRAPEPPTQAMPVKRRVSTKMGLPAPAEVPPGLTSPSGPPPALENDGQSQQHTPAPVAVQNFPRQGLGSTLLGMTAPRPVEGQASEAPRAPQHKLGGMEVLPAQRSTAPHAPRISSDLARTQRSATEEDQRAAYPSSSAVHPFVGQAPGVSEPPPGASQVAGASQGSGAGYVAGPPALPASFGKTLPSSGSEPPDLKKTLPSSTSEPPATGAPASPRARVVSVLTADTAQPGGKETLASTLVTPGAPAVSSPAVAHTVTAVMPTVLAPSTRSSGQPSAPAAALPPVIIAPSAQVPSDTSTSNFVSAPSSSAGTATGTPAAHPSAVRVSVPVATSRAVPDDVPRAASSRPPVVQPAVRPEDDTLVIKVPKRRSSAGGWIVALVVLGAVALLAGTVGKPYIAGLLGPKSPPAVEPRVPDVAPFLAKADELFLVGDLEGAREQLGRADAVTSSVGQPNVTVARKLARFDVAAADVEWLRLRLLAPDDAPRVSELTRLLERRIARARSSVDAATKLGDDPALAATKADLARLNGDVAGARTVAASLPAGSLENAYTRAALALTEEPPNYPAAVDLLGPVVSSEGNLGLGRSALVLGLVRSGDATRAQAELAHMKERSTSAAASPLLSDLASFVARESGSVPPAGSAVEPLPSAALTAPAPGTPPAAPGAVVGPRIPADFRARLTLASQALGKGDLAQADTLYRSVLREHPTNTEALAGLADVARRKGQSAEAAHMYEQVLASNPSYLPALIGRADQLWASGDRSGALKLYRRVTDQVGTSGHYGQHAQARINEAEGSKSPSPTPSPAPPSSPAPTAAPDSSPIDTTDLE